LTKQSIIPTGEKKVKDKLFGLTGIKNIEKNSCEPNFEIEMKKVHWCEDIVWNEIAEQMNSLG